MAILAVDLMVCPFRNVLWEGEAVLADTTAEVNAQSVRVVAHHLLKVLLNVASFLTGLKYRKDIEVVLDDAVTPQEAAHGLRRFNLTFQVVLVLVAVPGILELINQPDFATQLHDCRNFGLETPILGELCVHSNLFELRNEILFLFCCELFLLVFNSHYQEFAGMLVEKPRTTVHNRIETLPLVDDPVVYVHAAILLHLEPDVEKADPRFQLHPEGLRLATDQAPSVERQRVVCPGDGHLRGQEGVRQPCLPRGERQATLIDGAQL